MKLAIVTTHPIQYNAPWFRMLAERPGVTVKVFYTWEQSNSNPKFDPGFGRVVTWDIPLLDGYDHTFVANTSSNPGSHHFKGIINPTLNKEIEGWGAGAVLIFGWPFQSHLSCMRYFKGKIPVLFRGDSTLLDERGGLKQILRRLFLRYVYSFVDYALYVGTNNKDYFLAHGLKEKQLVHVPHAIDNERFSAEGQGYTARALERRAGLGINADDFVILFAGKFNNKKNPLFMLQLAKLVPDERVKFLMVGNGELEQELKAAADKRILFIDFQNQSEMPVVYHMADVFVLPSVGPGETWGLAINEALACGKYVITTTRVGGAVDLVQNNVNGLVVAPGDVAGAANYINGLLKGEESGARKEVNRRVLDTHSFRSIVSNLSGLLTGLSTGRMSD